MTTRLAKCQKIYQPERLVTRRDQIVKVGDIVSESPGDFISVHPGDFVGIRSQLGRRFTQLIFKAITIDISHCAMSQVF
ncbi:hypothetical protein [Bradyrhizobium sp. Tv2a-2]|uniref:hypothetical protein n=1 Tax=Bradyrhizobium sp. Tv2a-2 TaxID=113395 RepID=UPI000411629A|nr:hypothetical protein [Bradyrhizobium sp. Tv2a-2]